MTTQKEAIKLAREVLGAYKDQVLFRIGTGSPYRDIASAYGKKVKEALAALDSTKPTPMPEAIKLAREKINELCDHTLWGGSIESYHRWVSGLADEALAALDSVKEPEPIAWQPIETAPKNYTQILGMTDVGQMVVFFADGLWREKANWLGLKNPPTHWMPLPAPPISEVK